MADTVQINVFEGPKGDKGDPGDNTLRGYYILAEDYGVLGDGGEYTTELQAAIDAAFAASRRMEVLLPNGTFLINDTIKIPHQVWVKGVSRRSTKVQVTTDFPAGKAMFQVGRGSQTYQEGNGISDLEISGWDGTIARAEIGVHMWRVNEHSAAERITIKRCKKIGILCGNVTGTYEGDGGGSIALNFYLRDIWISVQSSVGWGSDTDSKAVWLESGVNERVSIEKITCVCGSEAGSKGIYDNTGGFSQLSIENGHFEHCEIGIHFAGQGGTAKNINGHSSVENVIAVDGGVRVALINIRRANATVSTVTYNYESVSNRDIVTDNLYYFDTHYFTIDEVGNQIMRTPRYDRGMRVYGTEGGKSMIWEFYDHGGDDGGPLGLIRRKYDNTPPANRLDGLAVIPGYIRADGSPVGTVDSKNVGTIYIEQDASPAKVYISTDRGTSSWIQIG